MIMSNQNDQQQITADLKPSAFQMNFILERLTFVMVIVVVPT